MCARTCVCLLACVPFEVRLLYILLHRHYGLVMSACSLLVELTHIIDGLHELNIVLLVHVFVWCMCLVCMGTAHHHILLLLILQIVATSPNDFQD